MHIDDSFNISEIGKQRPKKIKRDRRISESSDVINSSKEAEEREKGYGMIHGLNLIFLSHSRSRWFQGREVHPEKYQEASQASVIR